MRYKRAVFGDMYAFEARQGPKRVDKFALASPIAVIPENLVVRTFYLHKLNDSVKGCKKVKIYTRRWLSWHCIRAA